MGSKRSFDEEFPELPCKHSRKLEHSNMPNPFAELLPCENVPQEPVFSGENNDGFYKFQRHDAFEKNAAIDVSSLVDKGLETNDPLSWVSSSSSEEDAGSGTSTYSSLSSENLEFDFSHRRFVPYEDAYSSFWDDSPRKQVPIGTNHQASIPLWGKHITENKLDPMGKYNQNIDDTDSEEKLMGVSVIQMPDSGFFTCTGDYAGNGRTDCHCLDSGSVRCIRQHVREAQEKIKKTIGIEKFVNLGFFDMGEDVADRWTEEEEQIFHEVVYSNPTSLGRNFWKHLSLAFPYRNRTDLVSYYFNVFMLRRRAAQNRSNLLDIDSDDDEWHGNNRGSYVIGDSEEDEDSAIESLVDQDNQVDSSEEDGSDDDDCNGDGDDGPGRDYPEEDGGMDLMSDADVFKSFDERKFDSLGQHVDKTPGSDQEDFNAQDDSCLSFDCQANMASSCGPINRETGFQVCGVKSENGKCLQSKTDWCSDAEGQFNLLGPYDAEVWDCPSASSKGFDLLSTWNMMEEIFGQDASDKKMMGD